MGTLKKILILDDEQEIADELKCWLSQDEGYQVDCVTRVEDAIPKIQSKHYDLLIVDILLQGFTSGVDFIAGFKNDLPRPKIIVLTAVISQELEHMLETRRITHLVSKILKKPDDAVPDGLLAAVRQAIG